MSGDFANGVADLGAALGRVLRWPDTAAGCRETRYLVQKATSETLRVNRLLGGASAREVRSEASSGGYFFAWLTM